MYYNTTNLSREELRNALNGAKNQNERILVYFKANKGNSYSPSQIYQAVFDDSTPITSVRRSISVLTDQGKLNKTTEKIQGIYGKPEHKWKYYGV